MMGRAVVVGSLTQFLLEIALAGRDDLMLRSRNEMDGPDILGLFRQSNALPQVLFAAWLATCTITAEVQTHMIRLTTLAHLKRQTVEEASRQATSPLDLETSRSQIVEEVVQDLAIVQLHNVTAGNELTNWTFISHSWLDRGSDRDRNKAAA